MVKALTQLLCDQLQRQIKLGFSKVQMNKTKDLKFGNYPSYGFDFSFKLPHPSKGEIDGWGRVQGQRALWGRLAIWDDLRAGC